MSSCDFLFVEFMAASSFLSRVLALDDLLIRVERIHRQIGLRCVFYIRLIVTGTVAPPLQLSVIKEDLARVQHLLPFGDRRMAIAAVK